MINFASRAYDRRWRIDPIVRSLLDTDFYKLLMLQLIHRHFAAVPVTFSLINRSRTVRLADMVERRELEAQLDHVRTLHLSRQERIWLAGNTFYGTEGIFSPDFLTWLSALRLPEYEIRAVDGQYELTFSGPWAEVMLWEVYAVTIVNTLRNRAGLARMSELELDVLYSRAKAKLWGKLDRLAGAGVTGIADFSTRRRADFLYQEWALLAAADNLGNGFLGTSNVALAMKLGLEAIGTNAHELPMVLATLADTEAELRASQYRVLELWQQTYDGRLKVFLPDTFGTTQFLSGAPDWVADWTGLRVDSKDPFEAGEEAIAWWTARGRDPRGKLVLFSDGLDVDDILALDKAFRGRCRLGFGWGTLFGNDFRDCHPRGADDLAPISLVCKVTEANGRPAVKLSDNLAKPTGPTEEVARYRAIFGRAGLGHRAVVV
ncbi:MAG: nicotinate [Rhodospirillaceae bacterium]|nr:MAG: nicotinate [Rhodospirillaceae bacterium]TNC97893.1 MAG: nicotinate phosphoribosyltransferase [Stygiobacter sp.]